jgi:hypothetical protein
MQYITWNDYHENTNLTPGINTRYAYYDLTGYFIRWWKTGEAGPRTGDELPLGCQDLTEMQQLHPNKTSNKPPAVDRDKVYIFSHKYADAEKIYPFKGDPKQGNVIEVLTILPQAATIRVPGRKLTSGEPARWDAPAGLSFKQLPLTPGPVSAELIRQGKVELRLELPEPVGTRPFRRDIGKTAICSEFDRHWCEDFGDVALYVYTEYADADGDGLPNWFEMLWFGKFGDMSTATVAEANADPDRDGKTNLEEYKGQTDPTKSEHDKKME